jgi:hypothetical protein
MYEWLIPDGYLPGGGDKELPGHEAICLVNTTGKDAQILLDVYFVDRDPILGVQLTAPAQRSAHWGIGGPYKLPGVDIPERTPFSLRLRSETCLGVQYTRVWSFPDRLGLMSVFVTPNR